MFYQNVRSIYSRLVTLIMNRIGDCFFLVAITLFSYASYRLDCAGRSYFVASNYVLIALTIRFMTKSAIFPFSPWLPLAMSAPTPISALVHSSTLVTSGLYLIMRFSYSLYSREYLCELIVVVSVFTSFYAGVNRVFEVDLKKIVALSTLSHLGFISSSLFLGLLEMRFFHLISHALFKSLLFIALGDVLIGLNHSQDTRYLSSGLVYTPFSFYAMYIAILSLLGIAGTVGYFSKDLILELYCFTNISNIIFVLLVLNVCFTFFYTLKLFYYSFSVNKLMPYQLFSFPGWFHAVFLLIRGVATLLFGFFFRRVCYPFLLYLVIPLRVKLYPLGLVRVGFILLFMGSGLLTVVEQRLSLYGGRMCFLSVVCVSFAASIYGQVTWLAVSSSETGLFAGLLRGISSQVLKGLAGGTFRHLTRPSLSVFFLTFIGALFIAILVS